MPSPWSDVGVDVDPGMTSEEILKAAGLDWDVMVKPAQFTRNDGTVVTLDSRVLVKSTPAEEVLTQAPKKWNPVQNRDAFGFFREFCDRGQLVPRAAGSLRGGRRPWLLAACPTAHKVGRGETITGHVLFSNPHEYGQSVELKTFVVREPGNLFLAIPRAPTIVYSHRKPFLPEEAKPLVTLLEARAQALAKSASFMIESPCDAAHLREFASAVHPLSGVKQNGVSAPALKVIEARKSAPAEFKLRGEDWWHALCAVAYVVDYERGSSPATRLNAAWFLQGESRKLQALNLALETSAIMADA